MIRTVLLSGIIALLLMGCGRKEPPQPLTESSPPPRIVSLEQEQNYNSLKLTMRLAGAGGVLGYQVDRARTDPICHCRTPWRRDYEFQPRPGMDQERVTRLIGVRTPNVEFFYRVRAVDALGRLGPWSDPIRIKVVPK